MAVTNQYTSGFGTAGGNREQLDDVLTVLKPTSLELWNRLSHENVQGTYVKHI